MTQNSKPKHQHWVPKFYLKYFATPDSKEGSNPKVYVLDKTGKIPEPCLITTKSVCGKRYLYSPTNTDGVRDWSFEEFLGKMEADAADYWAKLASGEFDLHDG